MTTGALYAVKLATMTHVHEYQCGCPMIDDDKL